MSAVLQTSTTAPSGIGSGRRRGYESGARELADTPVAVSGQLPDWLRGRLLLNGPALWELPQGAYRHWFDGLAMLHAIRFEAGGVHYRSRFLQSQDYLESIAAGRPAMAGFATDDAPGLWRRIRAIFAPQVTDNAAVVMSRVGDRWVATTEAPVLVGFDPQTLDTTGALRLDDKLTLHLMSAHGITDARGDYWNVGVQFGPSCTYRLFRLRAGTTRRELVGSVKTKASGYLHAFAMSARHAIVWETAMRAQPLGFVFTGRAYIRNFEWRPRSGSMLHAISLDDGKVASWSLPSMMCFHAVQAFERDDERVVDLAIYDDDRVFDDLMLGARRRGAPVAAVPRLVRCRLQPGRPDAVLEPLGDGLELPQVHPDCWARREAHVAWGAGFNAGAGGPFDRTLRVDLDSGARREWKRGDAVQLEPLFVPRPGGQAEDDGVLLVPTLADGDAGSVVAVLDPASLECRATLALPQVVPFGFHAAYAAA